MYTGTRGVLAQMAAFGGLMQILCIKVLSKVERFVDTMPDMAYVSLTEPHALTMTTNIISLLRQSIYNPRVWVLFLFCCSCYKLAGHAGWPMAGTDQSTTEPYMWFQMSAVYAFPDVNPCGW